MLSSPGVTDAAYFDPVPLGFEPSWWEELRIEGYAPRPNENMNIFRNVISSGYLPLMEIPILEGRNLTEHDDENASAVMIVNEAFVRRFLPGRNPIGVKVHAETGFVLSVSPAMPSITISTKTPRRISMCPFASGIGKT